MKFLLTQTTTILSGMHLKELYLVNDICNPPSTIYNRDVPGKIPLIERMYPDDGRPLFERTLIPQTTNALIRAFKRGKPVRLREFKYRRPHSRR